MSFVTILCVILVFIFFHDIRCPINYRCAIIITKGKIFGSVNTIQVAESLKEKGFEIDRKNITFKEEIIKEVGNYTANIKLHKEVTVELPFEIVSE